MTSVQDLGIPGGEWTFSAPNEIPLIWGWDQEVAWPVGEALIICGSDGAGKTALAHNLIVRQLGIVAAPLFGLTVLPRNRILYLAQDRPRQAQRALKRLVGQMDKDVLDEALVVIDWPLEPLEDKPELLVELASDNRADTIYVDSLKDIVKEPSSEATGIAVRRAYSLAIAAGVEVCILHHDRKAGQESRRKILKLSDVYGSRFITAGAGSVIALNGGSGDPIIDLRHLKQPSQEVGPLKVGLDFETGEMSIFEGTDLHSILQKAPKGVTANDAARALFGTEAPTPKERERARRKLETEVKRGRAQKMKGESQTSEATYITPENSFTFRLTGAVSA